MSDIANQPPIEATESAALSPLKRAFLALEQAQSKVAALERAASEPIAIVGLGCRVPGGGKDSESLWRVLRDGVDAISGVPRDRFDIDALYDPDPAVPGKIASREGGFLEQVDLFDASFFGISPREAQGMDPQQRLLLEVCWEALEHAAQAPDRLEKTRTGVYIGAAASDYTYLQLHTRDKALLDAHFTSGMAHSVFSGRLSYLLGLQGPSITIDTACSSSLVAVHLACQALRNKECDLALAGGVNLILAPDLYIALSHSRMLAPDGRCKTFDAAADGFGRSEGCGIVVLKRLSEAVRAGDRVLAVIRGSAVNQDGPSSGLTAPNGPAQEAVIREALSRAGLTPGDVSLIEAHGTGTQLGDPLEIQALGAVFSGERVDGRPVMVGSIKTNVGHLEAAAGVTGLIKLVLALRHRTIPRHLHFTTPSPHIPWQDLPVRVAAQTTPWESSRVLRVAGVSSFGFSGTNAHVVIEEAPEAPASTGASDRTSHLFVLSARSPKALTELAAAYETRLAGLGDAQLGDICYTASAGRAHFSERATMLVKSTAELRTALRALCGNEPAPGLQRATVTRRDPPRIAFLYTGQGSQYSGMTRALYHSEPLFRRELDRCASYLDGQLPRPLLDILYSSDDRAQEIDQTALTQPVLFAIEYALTKLWQSWGINPAAVLGHSVGELVAACVAGVFELDDALRLVARRGALMQALPSGGAMAAITADEASIEREIRDEAELSIAAINGPAQTVVSGGEAAVRRLCERLSQRGVQCRSLAVSHAFHSPMVEPILETFEVVANSMTLQRPQIRMISNLTGKLVDPSAVTQGRYWRDLIRAPVRFAEGLETLRSQSIDCLLEIGPQPVLSGFAAAVFGAAGPVCVASLKRTVPDDEQLLQAVAALYRAGAPLDWKALAAGRPHRVIDLPSYAFQRERYWFQANPPRTETPQRALEGANPLLGGRLRLAGQHTAFESEVGAEMPAFLGQHRVLGRIVMPATAYLETMAACAREIIGADGFELENVRINEALLLEEGTRTYLQTVLTPTDGKRVVSIHSLASDAASSAPWTTHVTAEIGVRGSHDPHPVDLGALRASLHEEVLPAVFYADFPACGLDFGPAFHSLRRIHRGESAALGLVELDGSLANEVSSYSIHPVLLDGCLQLVKSLIVDDGALFLPIGVGRYTSFARAPLRCWCHASVTGSGDTRRAELRVFDERGLPVAKLEDVRFKRASRDALDRLTGKWLQDSLYEVRWEPLVAASDGARQADGVLLIAADAGQVGTRLADCLGAEFGEARLFAREAELLGALNDADEAIAGVVCLWPLDDDKDLQDASAVRVLRLAQAMIRHPHPPRLWIVTRGAQGVPHFDTALAPMQAAAWGLGRTLAAAHPELRAVCIDLDARACPEELGMLAAELSESGAEQGIAFRSTQRLAARLGRLGTPVDPALGRPEVWRLAPVNAGSLDEFRFEPSARRAPASGEVEIEVEAAALNFRDVLNVLGMYPGDAGPLGGECAGRVIRVGPEVRELKPGDAVMAVAGGAFASHVIARQELVQRRPEHVGAAEAASFPIAFLTAAFCLEDRAQLRPGEKVLIHAAAGGVGLAAVKLALRAGAEVFATAGSTWKRDFLRSLGIAQVFDSRSARFEQDILAATGGTGVDVVLNSLTGELLEPTFRVLKSGGRFVEIGKRGIKDPAWVAQQRRDWRYFVVDWSETAAESPQTIASLFTRLARELASGVLAPLPRHAFALEEASRAFRFMSQARHLGKIVLQYSRQETAPIHAQGSYVVTGGLSGLGLRCAAWLAARGAGRIVLIGRRGMTDAAIPVIEDLRRQGSRVDVHAADAASEAAMHDILSELRRTGPPLRGVMHCAAVLEDASVLQQSAASFAHAFRPKVDAARVLDRLTRGDALDWFVLFSSAASILGSAGQANYAAANAVVDALAHARRQLGLPALSVNWGPWADSGVAAERGLLATLAARGLVPLQPPQAFQALERLLELGCPQAAVMPVDWSRYLAHASEERNPVFLQDVAKRAVEMAMVAVRSPLTPALDSDLRLRIAKAPELRRRPLLAAFVREHAMRALGWNADRLLEPTIPLGEVGLDSLLAVELRNTLGRALQVTLPATLLFDYPSIDSLTDFLLSGIPGTQTPTDIGELAGPGERSVPAGLVDSIEALSDDEVDRLIASRARESRA